MKECPSHEGLTAEAEKNPVRFARSHFCSLKLFLPKREKEPPMGNAFNKIDKIGVSLNWLTRTKENPMVPNVSLGSVHLRHNKQNKTKHI